MSAGTNNYSGNAVKHLKNKLFGATNAAYSHLKGISQKKGSAGYELVNEFKKIEEGYKDRYAKVEYYKRKGGEDEEEGKLVSKEGLRVFEDFRKFDDDKKQQYTNLRHILENFRKSYSEFERGKTNMKPVITKEKNGYGIEKRKVPRGKAEKPEYQSAGEAITGMEENLKKSYGEYDRTFGDRIIRGAQNLNKRPAPTEGEPWRDYGLSKEEYKTLNEKFPGMKGDYSSKNVEKAINKIGKKIGTLKTTIIPNLQKAKEYKEKLNNMQEINEELGRLEKANRRVEEYKELKRSLKKLDDQLKGGN